MNLEVALSDEALAAINERVASGEFASPSAVVEAALSVLADHDARVAAFRAAVAEGMADVEAGRVVPVDDSFWARLRAAAAGARRD